MAVSGSQSDADSSLILIATIRPGMRGLRLTGKVVKKGDPFEISTRYGPAMVCDAEIEDDSGKMPGAYGETK